MGKSEELEKIAREIRACAACPLHEGRKNAVPGSGDPQSMALFIGEAPGKKEDDGGKPFCGAAGKLLTQMLVEAGISRDCLFITNTVKCRPPGNRKPKPGEIKACSGFLQRQIAAMEPKVIVLLGAVAAKEFIGTDKISQIHGKAVKRGGRVIVPLYHPAAGIYNRKLRPQMMEDIKQVTKYL